MEHGIAMYVEHLILGLRAPAGPTRKELALKEIHMLRVGIVPGSTNFVSSHPRASSPGGGSEGWVASSRHPLSAACPLLCCANAPVVLYCPESDARRRCVDVANPDAVVCFRQAGHRAPIARRGDCSASLPTPSGASRPDDPFLNARGLYGAPRPFTTSACRLPR